MKAGQIFRAVSIICFGLGAFCVSAQELQNRSMESNFQNHSRRGKTSSVVALDEWQRHQRRNHCRS